MTLIVGIITRDAIVVGADGQLTGENSKIVNQWKVNCIPFANRSVLIGESGTASVSTQALDYLKRECMGVRVSDSEAVENLVVKALRQVRNHQMSLYPKRRYPLEQWKKFFCEEVNFELTVAYYDHQAMPHLFTVDIAECVCRKPTNHFTTSGCAAELGQYILTEYTEAGMQQDLGVLMAIYALEKAIKHNPYCGRPLRIGVISKPGPIPGELEMFAEHKVSVGPENFPGRVATFGEPDTKELAEIILMADQETKEGRNSKLLNIVSERSARKWEKMLKLFGEPPSVEGPPEFE